MQRVISEYRHVVRHYDYPGSLIEFCVSKKHQNIQSRCLRGLPLNNIFFLGITERYQESLELLNCLTGLEFPVLASNLGKSTVTDEHQVTPRELAAIYASNLEDVELYERALRIFDKKYNDMVGVN